MDDYVGYRTIAGIVAAEAALSRAAWELGHRQACNNEIRDLLEHLEEIQVLVDHVRRLSHDRHAVE
ncbi:hypothetical protein KM427_00335 [Nocardioides sp. LMS-CY]|uniref:hypothetical protein n=1 Tax=Nocardioides sp. (strain LMS-CY) TaxID=2840457 RepID=UPI001C004EB4|nr:hypothetical protein [Nocardioides sp. LMS-CY]QWF22236.1 hypothetical protein KM427_00335 [Nocardioides sp. LMS-CY]